ncbi:hypothetical protein SO802_014390 [Lithocarpus litseifolius]|uniref:DDE Tnp4 domain-containing protein n=1 Tax=Lithocarpus litseifolius TaxID=425828 RepID=A0AAW2CT05_9ROSI
MSSHMFRQLCTTLHTQYGYNGTKGICLEESVAMTLVVLGHASGNRIVQDRFQHSGETVHRHVATVVTLLATVMAADIIQPADRTFRNVLEHIQHSSRYWPHFKGCIGAIDGVHVSVAVPVDEQHLYKGRKGTTTTNCMCACDFDMKFTFACVGWEGSTHDTRIFLNCLNNESDNFLKPLAGKYYLVNSRYPMKRGFPAPYKGERAHEINDVERSRYAQGTYGHSERGHYDATANVISILDEAEMKEVRDNITASICRMPPS